MMQSNNLKQLMIAEEQYRNDLLVKINEKTLTLEEAAQCFAGWQMKNVPVIAQQTLSRHFSHENLYRKCLLDLESRLPDFDGISIKRHWPT